MQRLKTLSILVLALVAIFVVSGFQGGYTAANTVTQQVFNAKTSTGTSVIVQNVGQSAHWLTYCVTGGGGVGLSIQLEGSFSPSGPWTRISDIGTNNTGCSVIEGGGYYSNVRADIVHINFGMSVSAWYTGSAGPIHASSSATLGNGTPIGVVPGIAAASEGGNSFHSANDVITNPGTDAVIAEIYNLGGQYKTVYMHRAWVNCSAACTIKLISIGVEPMGCSATIPSPLQLGSLARSVIFWANESPCSVGPSGIVNMRTYNLPVGPTEIDLDGFLLPPTGQGIAITMGANLTGTVQVDLTWSER